MPNGVRKSQKSAHANNQRNKMAEKHTAEMDDLRIKHQEDLLVLDQRNKELTSEIAIAVKKLEKMEESEQIARLRLRLKDVRAKEKKTADDYLVAMTKLDDIEFRLRNQTTHYDKAKEDNLALVGHLGNLAQFLIKDAQSAEVGLHIVQSLKRFGRQEHPHLIKHLWKSGSPMQKLLNKALPKLHEQSLNETTTMEKQIRLVMDEYEQSDRYKKKKACLDEICQAVLLHYDQCWCKHDRQYCDPVAPLVEKWREAADSPLVRSVTIKEYTTTTTTTTTD